MKAAFLFSVFLGLLSTYNLVVAVKNRVVANPARQTFYRTLLALDGGGLRLHMTNQILKELEQQIKNYLLDHPEHLAERSEPVSSADDIEVHLADYFACIAGVSAGSWVGLYYASKGGNGKVAEILQKPEIIRKYGELYPGSAAGLDVFFEEYGSKIYPRGICGFPMPRISPRSWASPVDLPGLTAPLYPANGLEEGLTTFFGETKLSELHTSVIVHAYDVRRRNPILFTFNCDADVPYSAATVVQSRDALVLLTKETTERTREGRYLDVQREDFYLRDIARASSAMPAFHPAKRFHPIGDSSKDYYCVDGALVSPNPTMHSVNFMLRERGVVELNRIAALSIGSGGIIGDFAVNVGRGVRWLLSGDLLNIIIDGGSEAVQSNLHYLFYTEMGFDAGQFLRIQVLAQRESGYEGSLNSFTNFDRLDNLKRIGQMAAEDYREDLKDFVKNFVFRPISNASEEIQTT